MEDDFFFFFFLTGPLACCSVLRVNAPVQPRRPSTLTLVLIRRWTHLIPPLTPHSPFVPATSCPDPNIDPQVDQAYFAPHTPPSPHGFNYDISKTSLLYRLSLICFWHLRTVSKNRTNERQRQHSSGAVWESRRTSWAVCPNKPSGFRGRKELLNRASALVTTCP